jgi:hypothetical protein
VPLTELALKLKVCSAQMGELLETVGVAGMGITLTEIVPGRLVHPLTVCVTENVPLAEGDEVRKIFCWVEVKRPGPFQLNPPLPAALRLSVAPEQSVALPVTVGVGGIGLTVTLKVPGSLIHPFTFCVTEYIPVASVVAAVTEGFCTAAKNEFGPVQL